MNYVGLIPCGKTKREYPAPAREFYCGRGFRRSRQIVEEFCQEWAILSAKYGLVLPDQVVAPYNISLQPINKDKLGRGFDKGTYIMTAAERAEWASRVAKQIQKRWPDPDQVFIALLAKFYEKALCGRLVINPLRKKRSVVRFIWLATQAKRIQRSKAKPK